MDLKTYFFGLPHEGRERFSAKCGTSRGHLQNVAYGYKPCGPALAVLIEKNSGGKVTRKDLRSDWADIWPELKKRAA